MEAPYFCGGCGKPVLIVNQLTVRHCECKAPIIASMRAPLAGRGGLAEGRRGGVS